MRVNKQKVLLSMAAKCMNIKDVCKATDMSLKSLKQKDNENQRERR